MRETLAPGTTMRTAFLALLVCCTTAQADWAPVQATVDGKAQRYTPLAKAQTPWRICALLPQGKDKFWWGVSWGLAQQAAQVGVKIGIYQAGGYDQPQRQKAQFEECLQLGAQAIILATIDSADISPQITKASQQGVPVIDLTNQNDHPQISAHVYSSTQAMAQMAANYLLASTTGKKPVVGWLPGPLNAQWVKKAETGLQRSLPAEKAQVVHGGYAPTDLSSQMTQLRALLARAQPDFLLLNAVAAEAAARLMPHQPVAVPIVAYYSNEGVLNALAHSKIKAAVTSSPVIEARISVDLAVRVLEKKPYPRVVNPPITLLTPENVQQFNRSQLNAPEQQWFIARPLPK